MILQLKPEIASALPPSKRATIEKAISTLSQSKLTLAGTEAFDAFLQLEFTLCDLVPGIPEPTNQEPL